MIQSAAETVDKINDLCVVHGTALTWLGEKTKKMRLLDMSGKPDSIGFYRVFIPGDIIIVDRVIKCQQQNCSSYLVSPLTTSTMLFDEERDWFEFQPTMWTNDCGLASVGDLLTSWSGDNFLHWYAQPTHHVATVDNLANCQVHKQKNAVFMVALAVNSHPTPGEIYKAQVVSKQLTSATYSDGWPGPFWWMNVTTGPVVGWIKYSPRLYRVVSPPANASQQPKTQQ